MSKLTLLDIAKLTGNDKVVGLIEENVKAAPEIGAIPMRTIKGTSYKTGIRTGYPTTGFRQANKGQLPSKSTFRQALVEAFIFGGLVKCDKAVANAHEDGRESFLAGEASGVMESALRNLGSQLYYGTVNDAEGFPGLKASTVFGGKTAYGDDLTIDAGGTTEDTASSVYAVKFGPQDVQFIGGQGKSFDLPPFREELITDEDGKELDGLVSALTAWIGLQIGNENCVRRLVNLTAQAGKGVTDGLLADLLGTFPTGKTPDAIFMSRRSRVQLQKSRNVVLHGSGKNRPDQEIVAPLPTSYDDIPIIPTDSILNTDKIES